MTRGGWQVTYTVWTPEAVEAGEADDQGFTETDVTLRAALRAIGHSTTPRRDRPAGLEDSGCWFSTVDPERDYRTGAETYYSVHPPEGITPASYRRAARLLAGVP